MDDIADPTDRVPVAVAGLRIIGGLDRRRRGWRVGLGPEPHAPARPRRLAQELPRPDLPEHRDLGQAAQVGGGLGPLEPVEQREPILPDRPCVGLALGRGLGQPGVLDAAGVAPVPGGVRHDGLQPVRGSRGERIERRAQGLAHQFQPVQGPN